MYRHTKIYSFHGNFGKYSRNCNLLKISPVWINAGHNSCFLIIKCVIHEKWQELSQIQLQDPAARSKQYYSNFILAITVIHHTHISAMHTCPRGQWRIKAVRVYPLRPADMAAQKKLLRFTAMALVTCSLPSLHNGG